MEQKRIRNIPHQQALALAGQIEAGPGQIVSKILAQNAAVTLTLFAFSKGEEIGTHDSKGDALVHVLAGTARLTVGGAQHLVTAGQVLVMPAFIPHAVYAEEDFKMLLTVVFPQE